MYAARWLHGLHLVALEQKRQLDFWMLVATVVMAAATIVSVIMSWVALRSGRALEDRVARLEQERDATHRPRLSPVFP
jgi:hypothetical protein